MTLPTTRIDTLAFSPRHANNHTSGSGESPPNYSDNSQQILLVDIVSNGGGGGEGVDVACGTTATVGATAATPTSCDSRGTPLKQNFYPPFKQQQVPPAIQTQPQPGARRFPSDLTNFTLVNLSNQNEQEHGGADQDFQDDEEGVPMIVAGAAATAAAHRVGGSTRCNGIFSRGNGSVGSSTLDSSEDTSDTGFLVQQNSKRLLPLHKGRNKECQYSKVVKQHSLPPLSPEPGSTAAAAAGGGGHRRRLKRRRSGGGTGVGRGKGRPTDGGMGVSDAFPLCCCFCDDDNGGRGASLTLKYFRFFCLIFVIIVIATYTSILVSQQRKIESLSEEVSKLAENLASPKPDEGEGLPKLKKLEESQELLNASISSLHSKLQELSTRLGSLEKMPSVEEVRKELARLGSEMKSSNDEMRTEIEKIEKSQNQYQDSKHLSSEDKDSNNNNSTTPAAPPLSN